MGDSISEYASVPSVITSAGTFFLQAIQPYEMELLSINVLDPSLALANVVTEGNHTFTIENTTITLYRINSTGQTQIGRKSQ